MHPLAYSTNLHAAETVDDLVDTLWSFAGTARDRLGWDRLGLDLRLGSRAIAELADNGARDRLRRCLDEHRLSAHTLNAFPLGFFQAETVKREAYRPDWNEAQRLDDSIALIPIALALSDATTITISTVPGTYRPFGPTRCDPAVIAAAFGRWAAAAARAERDHGRRVVLCPEPEPWCLLETSHDAVAFWQGPLAEYGLAAAAEGLDGDRAIAADALRRHLGICFDTCHISLAFEDQVEAVARLRAAGVPIAKVQVSAAPEVRRPAEDADGLAALRALHEPRFLHQTAARSASGSVVKVEDLDQVDDLLARLPHAAAVRSHFHIPLFKAPQDHGLSTTIGDSLAALRAILKQPSGAEAPHVAVETYTWSVLADKEGDPLAGTVRELGFLRGAIDGLGA